MMNKLIPYATTLGIVGLSSAALAEDITVPIQLQLPTGLSHVSYHTIPKTGDKCIYQSDFKDQTKTAFLGKTHLEKGDYVVIAFVVGSQSPIQKVVTSWTPHEPSTFADPQNAVGIVDYVRIDGKDIPDNKITMTTMEEEYTRTIRGTTVSERDPKKNLVKVTIEDAVHGSCGERSDS